MKRLILLLLAYVVGGAIITVAVAWRCAWRTRDDDIDEVGHAYTDIEEGSDGRVMKSFWGDRREGFGDTLFIATWIGYHTTNRPDPGFSNPVEFFPRWLGFEHPSDEFRTGKIEYEVRAARLSGWPFRALACLE